MDYGRHDLADRLASEYVLGTLRGPARRRLETLLPAHPVLREAVARWQSRLTPLSEAVPPVAPPDQAWPRLEARLFPPPAADPRWWQRLTAWRAWSALTTAALVALVVVGPGTPPIPPPIVVVLAANPDAAQARPARFVASLGADGRSLVLKPIDAPTLTAQQALELWAVPASGAPRSLGLVSAAGTTTLQRAELLRDTAAFAVSIEPTGGSPTGAPTGPIVSLGQLSI
jgi:anti-sigma-K factor RskA